MKVNWPLALLVAWLIVCAVAAVILDKPQCFVLCALGAMAGFSASKL